MTTRPFYWRGIVRLSSIALCCLCMAAGRSSADEPNGVVRIEGKHIERLVFCNLAGEIPDTTFTDPNETVRLPAGSYYVREIHLRGDYRSYSWRAPRGGKMVVSEDEETVLKMGAPLTQKVTVRRQGNRLELNYELLGIGGEKYSSDRRRDAPKFIVYQGEAKVGSGTFAYG